MSSRQAHNRSWARIRRSPRTALIVLAAAGLALGSARSAYAMHIAEGFLPPLWALFWFAVALPFFVLGLRSIRAATTSDPAAKLTLGLSGAFAFVLSALKMPSVSGSSSHPTGVALGAILCGPLPMVVLGTIVLLFQAILLAHGGLTTLGANVFSMAVVGPFVGYAVYRLFGGRRLGWAVFAAATVSDLATYFVTAGQLALAFPSPTGGVLESLVKFLGVFAFTQIPLAVSEGILTSVMFQTLAQYDRARLVDRGVIAA